MSNKILTVLAVLAAGCFIALITLQVIEWRFYRTEPSAFLVQPK